MKTLLIFCCIVSLIYCNTLVARPRLHSKFCSNLMYGTYVFKCGLKKGTYIQDIAYTQRVHERCVNVWDEGCINGQLAGSGNDDGYLNGGFNPGKRCVNVWDEGCINGQLSGSGNDDGYLNGGFNPGKRCVNMWDEGCVNGQLAGSGNDDYFLNGGFNPGKRCVNMWDEGCINGQLNGSGDDDNYLNGGFNPGKRSLQNFLAKIHKSHNF